MMYLYIFEDNTISQSPVGPTSGDLNAIQREILTVIRFELGKFELLSENNKWIEVEMFDK